nr:hypothetical protein [Tanacetum cinerariifolium]
MRCLPRSACLRSNELDQIPPILERMKGDKNGTKEHPREDCSVHESASGIYSSDYGGNGLIERSNMNESYSEREISG